MSTAAEPRLVRRRPWVAGLLSFIVPGLGHVYAGAARRGLIVGAAATATGILLLWGSMVVPVAVLRLLMLALAFGAVLYASWDSFDRADRVKDRFVLRSYNRWYVYAAIWLIVGVGISPYVIEAVLRNIAHAYRIRNISMEPAVLEGDYILAAPLRGEQIERGTIAVIHTDTGFVYTKRIVGLPGDTVEMRDGVLYTNGIAEALRRGTAAPEGEMMPHMPEMLWQRAFLAHSSAAQDYRPTFRTWGPLVIPAGQYFVLGDKRDQSLDSRLTGFVPRSQIAGRIVWVYYSKDYRAGTIRWGRLGYSVE